MYHISINIPNIFSSLLLVIFLFNYNTYIYFSLKLKIVTIKKVYFFLQNRQGNWRFTGNNIIRRGEILTGIIFNLEHYRKIYQELRDKAPKDVL